MMISMTKDNFHFQKKSANAGYWIAVKHNTTITFIYLYLFLLHCLYHPRIISDEIIKNTNFAKLNLKGPGPVIAADWLTAYNSPASVPGTHYCIAPHNRV